MEDVIQVEDVQQWLEGSKLSIAAVEPTLANTVRQFVLGQLIDAYDVSTWIDKDSTPSLVRSIMGGLLAAWTYNKQYAEDVAGANDYGNALESLVMSLLGDIAGGSIDLLDGNLAAVTRDAHSYPKFWPTDLATTLSVGSNFIPREFGEPDGSLGLLTGTNSAPRAFSMGQVF